MSKMDRPLTRQQMGDYIRDRLDQAHEAHPERDDISRKAMAYGHRKPYSGTQYYIQLRRKKAAAHESESNCEDSDSSVSSV